jgi:hypothetical protein
VCQELLNVLPFWKIRTWQIAWNNKNELTSEPVNVWRLWLCQCLYARIGVRLYVLVNYISTNSNIKHTWYAVDADLRTQQIVLSLYYGSKFWPILLQIVGLLVLNGKIRDFKYVPKYRHAQQNLQIYRLLVSAYQLSNHQTYSISIYIHIHIYIYIYLTESQHLKLRDFTSFNVNLKRRNCPSARCASAVNAIRCDAGYVQWSTIFKLIMLIRGTQISSVRIVIFSVLHYSSCFSFVVSYFAYFLYVPVLSL